MPWKGGGMLNQRQMEIILQMFETPEIRRTTSELAEERQVSMRTIQTDLKVIREALADRPCVSFISDRRGSMVHITDPDGFEELKEQYILEYTEYTNIQDERIDQIYRRNGDQ